MGKWSAGSHHPRFPCDSVAPGSHLASILPCPCFAYPRLFLSHGTPAPLTAGFMPRSQTIQTTSPLLPSGSLGYPSSQLGSLRTPNPSIVLYPAAPLHYLPRLSEVESTFRRAPPFTHSLIGSSCATVQRPTKESRRAPYTRPWPGRAGPLLAPPYKGGAALQGARALGGAASAGLGSARLDSGCSSGGGGWPG